MSHDDDRQPSKISGTTMVVFVLVGYLVPFFIVLIDEGVFRTFFFSKHFGPWGRDAFHAIYFPFFKVFKP